MSHGLKIGGAKQVLSESYGNNEDGEFHMVFKKINKNK
jgi:hypothetical protein